ncbi:MAG: radical SAM protein, partial [bacterium]
SLMSLKFVEKILEEINKFFKLSSNLEISFEINPGAMNLGYLRSLRNLGVNRISCGVQSFNLFALRIMGRTHSVKDIFTTINFVEKTFENYNLDLLALYPYQDVQSLKEDLQEILNINPPHVSYYLMDIDKGVNYSYSMIEKIKANYELADVYYSTIKSYLERKYVHYEISNFARDNYYCRHNLKYWYYFDYIGIGPSAVSKITLKDDVYRLKILPNVIMEIEKVEKNKQQMERLMLALRTKWGIIVNFQNSKKYLKIRDFENYNSKIFKYFEKVNFSIFKT